MATAPDFDSYARSISNWINWEAYRLCGDWYEAEDLAQVTLVKVYRRWGYLDGRDLLGGYTHRTLLHTYLSERRRTRWNREVLQPDVPDFCMPGPGPEDADVDLRVAVSRLAARQRVVIVLRFWDDFTVEQTAAALGCTPSTITSQTHRALARLRAALVPTHLADGRPTRQGPAGASGMGRSSSSGEGRESHRFGAMEMDSGLWRPSGSGAPRNADTHPTRSSVESR
jgi:DNA-directed RNA polymerase specialized sigma24 family protein